MEKIKAVVQSYGYEIDNPIFLFRCTNPSMCSEIRKLINLCEQKYSGYVQLEISPPYKKRTTGDGSQNNLIWRLITFIANETGNDIHDVEAGAKERAIKRGYPYRVNQITGRMNPLSMTEINTVEAGYLIDELYVLCAEYNINTGEVNDGK